MKIDLYTKIVLTVIALALSIIVVRDTFSVPAYASNEPCGSSEYRRCYVEIVGDVKIKGKIRTD